MKKNIGILVFAMLAITISGCTLGKQHLQCTSEGSASDISIEQTYNVYYLKDTISNVTVIKTYTFKDKKTFDSFKTVIDNSATNFNSLNKKYIQFSILEKSQKYITTLKVDMKDITSDELSALGMSKKVSDFKQQLEAQGLTCK